MFAKLFTPAAMRTALSPQAAGLAVCAIIDDPDRDCKRKKRFNKGHPADFVVSPPGGARHPPTVAGPYAGVRPEPAAEDRARPCGVTTSELKPFYRDGLGGRRFARRPWVIIIEAVFLGLF